MEQVGLAGLTLHETDVVGLEGLRGALERAPATFPRDLADELAASELVLLATCNRVEIAYARETGPHPGPVDRAAFARALSITGTPAADILWIRSGTKAVRHVLRVASSLDSLVVGEAQILGQVRDAFERARGCGLVGELLGPVFDAALQVGKQVRTQTDLSRHPVSVVSLGVQHLAARLADAPGRPRVALLGAGHMGRLAAKSLADAGIEVAVVANRTLARAEALAAEVGARASDLDAFRSGTHALDGLVTATGAPGTVLSEAELCALAARAPGGRRFVAVDLALPRDLPATCDTRIEVVDLDALREQADENRARRLEAAAVAEALVEDKLAKLAGKAGSQHMAAVVAETLAETNELFEHELARLLGGRLAHLEDHDRRTLERWARTTFGRLAHGPMRAFKTLAGHARRTAEGREGTLAPSDGTAGRRPA